MIHSPRSIKSSTLSLLIFAFASSTFAAKCYNPDGSLRPDDDDFQPCVLISGIDSMCCATNRDAFPDTCLANGLCHNPCKTAEDCSNIPGRYWREMCTDPTWKSPFCLKGICTNDNENGSANGTATLSQCATDGHWCCGDMTSEACCAMDSRFFLVATLGASSSTTARTLSSRSSTSSTVNQAAANSQSTFSSPASTTISSSIPISTSTSTPKHSDSHPSTGKSAGLGAGIGIGVLAIGILVFWFVVRQRKRRRARNNQYQRPMELDHDETAPGMPKYASNGTQLAQFADDPMLMPAEIDGTSRHEADGASSYGRQVNGVR